MKKLKLLLILVILALAGRVGAKNTTIQFDSNFKAIGSTSVEPNEVITLTGKFDSSAVVSFKITVIGALTPQEVPVNFKNSTWTAQVGPFFANQSVSLKFNVKSKLTEKEFGNFKRQFEETFSSVIKSIEATRGNHTEFTSTEKFFEAFAKKFKETIPVGFQQYKDGNNKPATEMLLEAFGENDKKELLNYANNLSGANEAMGRIKTSANEILKNPGISPKAKDYLKAFTDSLEFANKQLTKEKFLKNLGLKGLSEKDNINIVEIISSHDEIIISNKSRNGLLSKIEVLKESEVTCSLENSTTLSIDIKQFIGFDIVPMVFAGKNRPGDSSFGIFFSASPYFGRVNTDEKVWYPREGNEDSTATVKRRQGNWKRLLTPTIGIALVTSPDAKVAPVVFGGVGFRINPIVRLNIGWSAYNGSKTETDPKTQVATVKKVTTACFTMGIGINVDYFGEVLKIFTTASSNLHP